MEGQLGELSNPVYFETPAYANQPPSPLIGCGSYCFCGCVENLSDTYLKYLLCFRIASLRISCQFVVVVIEHCTAIYAVPQ